MNSSAGEVETLGELALPNPAAFYFPDDVKQ